MTTHLAVGLMSGTSLDGIDAVLVEIEGIDKSLKVKVIESFFQPYASDLRTTLLELCDPKTAALDTICSMNMYLGKLAGKTVNNLLKKAGISKEKVAFISSHGQTIYHIPEVFTKHPWEVPSTLQIGDISAIAEETHIATVGDFRPADMAANGQGAPLVSFVDYILFHDDNKHRAIQNIGGIGNVTYISSDLDKGQTLSFDTGPGNMVIDAIVQQVTNGKQKYDKDGELASRGKIIEDLLIELMNHPYFKIKPPKTTGREMFGLAFAKELMKKAQEQEINEEDLIATVTAWTAKSIADSYQSYLIKEGNKIDEVIIGGGGSYNSTLLSFLKEYLPNQKIVTHEDYGISSDLKEAIAFAVLGYYTIVGQFNQLPSATGADHPVIMGKVAYTQPEAYERLKQMIALPS